MKVHECRDYHIDLRPYGVITGRVTVNGLKPSQTWNIDAVPVEDDGVDAGSAFTDEEGRFEIHGLSPGRYRIGIEVVGLYSG